MADGEIPLRPLSAKELSDEANKFSFNVNIPFRQYVMAAETLYREGQNYLREQNYGRAYLLLLRYSTLVLDKIPTHPAAKSPESRQSIKSLRRRMPDVLQRLEDVRPQIDAAYDEWTRMTADRTSPLQENSCDGGSSASYRSLAKRDAALSWNPNVQAKIIDAGDNQDFAVELATREILRRRAKHLGITEEEDQERRVGGLWDGWASASGSNHHAASDSDLQRNMEAIRRRLDTPYGDDSIDSADTYGVGTEPPAHHYPSISKSSAVHYGGETHERSAIPSAPPLRPAKEPFASSSEYAQPPPHPRKDPYLADRRPGSARSNDGLMARDQHLPARPPKSREAEPSSEKRQRYTFRPAAYLENGEAIRSIFLPRSLRDTFLAIAQDNTRRGLEMCGILCGSLVNNAFFVSCLLIPEQVSTSDTCETTNEGATFEYCEENDLIVIGWIHTHPTQSCFMSSRDLHTQSGYQIMMPESIAIVCAPRHDPSWGIFRLTNPPGLPYVLQCNEPGTFHQHSIDGIYTSAKSPPGHVYESSALEFYVHDQRPKS